MEPTHLQRLFFFSHVHIHATALEAVQNPQPRFHLILLLLLLINIGSYTATCQSLWLQLAFAAPRGAFSCVLGTGEICWEKHCIVSALLVADMAP